MASSHDQAKLDMRLSHADRPAGSASRSRRGRKPGAKVKKRPSAFWRFMRWAMIKSLYWGSVLALWTAIAVGGVLVYYGIQLPQMSEWAVPERPPNIKIVAINGEMVANRGDTGGETVELEDLPAHVPQAVIAIEDRRFRRHPGLDLRGLARATVRNITAGGLREGGSTLTQQLAKNLFLTHERSFKRKVQEALLAIWLEAEFTKDEIIELYLNRVYFGAGAYGVDAAARRYFGKPATRLSVGEAATLAGLLVAPSRLQPNRFPDAAHERAKLVLRAMVREGYIDQGVAQHHSVKPVRTIAPNRIGSENYFADWIMDRVPDLIGSSRRDILVETTLDLGLQWSGERIIRETLAAQGGALEVRQGALVAMDETGAIKAMIGGRSYADSRFNRAAVAMRQPGSAFKPFVYLAALEAGMTPETKRRDAPITIDGWTPRNYSREYKGVVSLRQALSESLNTVAASLTQEVGADTVARTAQRLGMTSPLAAHPSLALGTSEVTLLDLSGAYAPLANGGYRVEPHAIWRITDTEGNVLFERLGGHGKRVISAQVLAYMNDMMAETLVRGTGKRAQLDDREAGGKTGTSQGFRDAWFVGYTPTLITGVWFGNDDNSPTNRASGGRIAASAWQTFMTEAHYGLPVTVLPGAHEAASLAQEAARETSQQGGGIGGFLRRIFGANRSP